MTATKMIGQRPMAFVVAAVDDVDVRDQEDGPGKLCRQRVDLGVVGQRDEMAGFGGVGFGQHRLFECVAAHHRQPIGLGAGAVLGVAVDQPDGV